LSAGFHCGRVLFCSASFLLFFFSCAGRSGRTGEPGEDIVNVSVGLWTHGRALQYPTRWLFAVASQVKSSLLNTRLQLKAELIHIETIEKCYA